MIIIALPFLVLGAVFYVLAFVRYAQYLLRPDGGRYAASALFDESWCIGTCFGAIGVAWLPGVPFWWGFVALVGLFLLGGPLSRVWHKALTLVRGEAGSGAPMTDNEGRHQA